MVLHTDVGVLLSLHESLNTWVDNLVDSRAFSGQCQGGTVDSVSVQTSLHVRKFCSKAHPPFAVERELLPFTLVSMLTLLFVVFSLVSIDPHSLSPTINHIFQRHIVLVGTSNRWGGDHLKAMEALFGALVLDQSQGVASRSPASDVYNLLARQVT